MSNVNDGGPAFPYWNEGEGMFYRGMSVRDYLAAHLAAAFVGANSPLMEHIEAKFQDLTIGRRLDIAREVIARNAYAQADAMLAARNPAPKETT